MEQGRFRERELGYEMETVAQPRELELDIATLISSGEVKAAWVRDCEVVYYAADIFPEGTTALTLEEVIKLDNWEHTTNTQGEK